MTHTVTQDFREEYEAERTRWLRRRFLWYTGILGAFVTLGLALSLLTVALGDDTSVSPMDIGVLGLNGFPQVVLLVGSFVYVLRRSMRQKSLLTLVFWLTVIIGSISVVTTLFLEHPLAPALFSVFITHFVASLFIPWTAREAAKPLVPLLAVLVVLTFVAGHGALMQKIIYIAVAPLVGVPGVAVCWWRHSRFRDRFLYRMVRGRYGELQRELIDARSVHESLFPDPVLNGPVRFHYRYEPMRQIGGDYLYACRESRTPDESESERLSIVLIDVTGHGIKAALTVNRLYGELERIFAESPDIEPGELLASLNRYVWLTLAKHDVYATALCMRFDPSSDELVYANAGHPPAFLRTAGGLMEQLDSTAPLLGVFERESYDAAPITIRFGPGDTIIAYTDGATDTANEAGDRLNIGGIQRILANDSAEPERKGRWAATLAREIMRFRFGAPVDDTLLVEVWRPIDGGK